MELASENEQTSWIRSSPADIFYKRAQESVEATPRLEALCTLFENELLERAKKVKQNQKPYNPPNLRRRLRVCKHKTDQCSSSSSSEDEMEDQTMEELSRKTQHPYRWGIISFLLIPQNFSQ